MDPAPVWSDVETFSGTEWRGAVDIITAGFPCQPWSVAGKRLGKKDRRWLWPHIFRVVQECRPKLVFFENVQLAAFRQARTDLESVGYRVPPAIRVSAEDVGAPHKRERWWVMGADSNCQGLEGWLSSVLPECPTKWSVGAGSSSAAEKRWACNPSWWGAEPRVGRVVDGLAHRVDRIRALGNGVIPLAVAHAFDRLIRLI